MTYVFLDGEKIRSNADLHNTFAASLDLPDWYGGNLDALHDVLTERADPVGIVIVNEPSLHDGLGRRAAGFFRLLRDLEASGNVRVARLSLDAPSL